MNYFDAADNKELKLFYARLDDLMKRADGGYVSHSAFLSPSEAFRAEKYFAVKGNKDRICFFGGYNGAQRKQIFLLPEYITLSADENTLFDMLAEDFDCSIKAKFIAKDLVSGREVSEADLEWLEKFDSAIDEAYAADSGPSYRVLIESLVEQNLQPEE